MSENPSGTDSANRCLELPIIIVNDRDLRDITAEALLALQMANDPPTIFIRGGSLVRVISDEHGSVVVERIDDTVLRGYLTRAADFRRRSVERGGEVRLTAVSPPRDIAQDLLAMCSDKEFFPVLRAISQTPIVHPDGTICTASGYDRVTGIYLDLDAAFEGLVVSDAPIDIEVDSAVDLIRDVIADFPFTSEVDKANYIGVLITVLIRSQFACSPVAMIDSPQPGTGKTLLALIVAVVYIGSQSATVSPPRPGSEEWGKLLTSLLLDGRRVVILDNLATRLDSDALASAITSPTYQARILGRSETVTLPQQSTFVVTGNNAALGEDLARRTYWIRLDARVSNPYKRTGFKHPDLLAYVTENRRQLMHALLTIVRAWYAAGKPPANTPVLGSFESWSRTIGAILYNAGINGFLENFDEHACQADDGSAQKEAFLWQVMEAFRDVRSSGSGPEQTAAFTAKDLTSTIRSRKNLEAALPEELVDAVKRESTQAVGRFLASIRDHRFGEAGIHVVDEGVTRDKVRQWRVRSPVSSL
ncbi:MAG: hypothetical protein KJZ79_16715 [Bryobacteraceae bacterium]|nr:hypothetical protein [Bryobacteraceae bacterium]